MPRMELIAGEMQDILVALGTTDADEMLRDADRFAAHLSLGGGIDPTWLDLFSQAVRSMTEGEGPADFLDSRIELGVSEPTSALTVERVDPGWVSTIARVQDHALDGIAGRWIDRLEEEFGPIGGDEKPWIRGLAGEVVTFCRTADRAPDIVFVWAL